MFAFTDMKDLNMLRDDSFLEKNKKIKKKGKKKTLTEIIFYVEVTFYETN